MLDRLRPPKGAQKKKKRLGRGMGSGLGKTSGRGHKGQNSRTGGGVKAGFEGGQMPLHRRLPKRGFHNKFQIRSRIVNLNDISRVFEAGTAVEPATLIDKGLIKARGGPVKVLGNGEVTGAYTVKANLFSKAAIDKIEAAGGKAEVV
ncbi:MAG: 50S ribosomal protein L15 [Proteobacteria bacterium]|nr:50S ribosomal protein L15 [Pseudomonadota bacterium]